MGFDDVAKRMADRRGTTRGEQLKSLWTGEPPELPPLPPLPEPVAPAQRTKRKVAAYVVLYLGLIIAMAGIVALVLAFNVTSRWEKRGLVVVIALGISIMAKAAAMFNSVAATAPLPGARLVR